MALSIAGDLRIVMLGISGAGKSTTGNTILGRDEFKVELSPESITQQTKKEMTTEGSRRIFIIDTPGLPDPSAKAHKVKKEINKCMKIAAPGPHVFLLVIRVDVRLTEEGWNTVKWTQENFGENVARHTIVVFTHTDSLHKPLRDHIHESPDLWKFVMSCGGRYHAINNKDRNNQSQVNELLDKMDELVIRNKGKHYTEEMFNKAQYKLKNVETEATVDIVVTVGLLFGALVVAAVALLKN